MKAIIVAAGRGRRLGTETDEIPKCMVKVGGRPILHWQLDALASAGVDDVVIVRGYLGDRIAGPAGAGDTRELGLAHRVQRPPLVGVLPAPVDDQGDRGVSGRDPTGVLA